MKWYSDLYIGASIGAERREIRQEISAGHQPPNIYILCLAANPADLLDIVPAHTVSRAGEYSREWEILGFARGKEEATLLAAVLMQDIFRMTGGFDVRNFVKGQMEED
jgi:hypothetical protein